MNKVYQVGVYQDGVDSYNAVKFFNSNFLKIIFDKEKELLDILIIR